MTERRDEHLTLRGGAAAAGRALFPPADALRRPWLLHALDRAASNPLVLVAAPAGTGKTAGVAGWLRRRAPDHAWLAAGPDDADGRATWADLLAALAPFAAPDGLRRAHAALAGGAELAEAVAPALAAALRPRGERLVVVVDDAHALAGPGPAATLGAPAGNGSQAAAPGAPAHGPAAAAALGAFAAAAPLGVTVVLCGRSRAALSAAEAAAGAAAATTATIGPRELALRPAEADRLLAAAVGARVPAERVALVQQRLGGWVGLVRRLAAVLAAPADGETFAEALGRATALADAFLGSQVLDPLGPELRGFLRRAALLDELTAPLADAIAGPGRGARLLAAADGACLLEPLPGRRARGTARALPAPLAAALQRELRRAEPAVEPELRRQAAAWLRAAGRPDAAARQAAAATIRASTWVATGAAELGTPTPADPSAGTAAAAAAAAAAVDGGGAGAGGSADPAGAGAGPGGLGPIAAGARGPGRAAAERRALLGTDPSPAELRVLRLLPSGLSVAEIGAELYLSQNTVKSHMRRLYRRLGATHRAAAVAAARERGLI